MRTSLARIFKIGVCAVAISLLTAPSFLTSSAYAAKPTETPRRLQRFSEAKEAGDFAEAERQMRLEIADPGLKDAKTQAYVRGLLINALGLQDAGKTSHQADAETLFLEAEKLAAGNEATLDSVRALLVSAYPESPIVATSPFGTGRAGGLRAMLLGNRMTAKHDYRPAADLIRAQLASKNSSELAFGLRVLLLTAIGPLYQSSKDPQLLAEARTLYEETRRYKDTEMVDDLQTAMAIYFPTLLDYSYPGATSNADAIRFLQRMQEINTLNDAGKFADSVLIVREQMKSKYLDDAPSATATFCSLAIVTLSNLAKTDPDPQYKAEAESYLKRVEQTKGIEPNDFLDATITFNTAFGT